MEDELD